jgi:hypothetical protein
MYNLPKHKHINKVIEGRPPEKEVKSLHNLFECGLDVSNQRAWKDKAEFEIYAYFLLLYHHS